MKKHSIILSLFIFFICFVSGISFVNAAALVETDSKYLEENGYGDGYTLYLYWVHDDNVSWDEDDNTYKYGNLYWPYKEFAIDGTTSYCIEPFVSTPSDLGDAATWEDYNSYQESTWEDIDESLRSRISLIAYYGYDYTGHKSSKYRLATQALIWETLLRENTSAPWYYTPNPKYTVSFYIHPTGEGYKYKDGVSINIESEKAEILSLVNAHTTLPSFANNEEAFSVKVGSTTKFTDTNNVLKDFEIDGSVDSNVIKFEGNTLSYSPNKEEEVTITFKKKTVYSKSYIVYSGGRFQNIIATGNPDATTFSVKLKGEVLKKEVKIVKRDADTNEIIKKSGIKFKIYDVVNNKYIMNGNSDIFATDNAGSILVALPVGSYRLYEVDQNLDGYLWNKEFLSFEVTTTTDNLELSFTNKAVKGSIEINKTGEKIDFVDNDFVYSDIKLAGVKFGLYVNKDIYNSSNELIYAKNTLIGEYITDNNGFLIIKDLYLGSYYLLELKTDSSHVLDKTKHEFELVYKDQYTENILINKEIKNCLSKGTLEFTKRDFSTSEALPNTIIEIYTNEENPRLVYTGKTDSFGSIIISELPVGKYYILEKEAPFGYELNPDKMYFEITYNGEIVKAVMLDKRNKNENKIVQVANVPNTGINDINLFSIITITLVGVGLVIYGIKENMETL